MEMYSPSMAGYYMLASPIQFFDNRTCRPLRNSSNSWEDLGEAKLGLEIAEFLLTRPNLRIKDILNEQVGQFASTARVNTHAY